MVLSIILAVLSFTVFTFATSALGVDKNMSELKTAYEIFLVVYREDGIFESGYNAAALLEAMQRFDEAKTLAEELAEKYGTRKVQRLLDDINYEIEMAEKFELQRGSFSQIQTE